MGNEAKVQEGFFVIYHDNCADGFGAAWVVHDFAKRYPALKVEFFGATYQDPPPDVTGRCVYIVDFSYKYPVLLKMAEKAARITIIDHHKSAQEDLTDPNKPLPNNVHVKFDMEHSGAMLTWQYFNGGNEPPELLKHIEDRDLWRFQLPYTREIQAAIFSYPYDFKVWDDLIALNLDAHINDGSAIERKHFKDIAELVKSCMTYGVIDGHSVPIANLPYTYSSDAGHYMAKHMAPEGFAACYWDTKDGRVFSLRSADEGMDVSAIAKKYGGGGHKHAAGFRVALPDGITL